MIKADLKEAMDLLEVKKPLRLSIKAHSKAPSFQVPSLPSGSIGDDPWGDSTLGSKTTLGLIQTQGQNLSQGQNPPQVQINPSGNSSLGGQQISRRSQPRRATFQDEAVVATKSVESGLVRGYTRVPNSLLMRMVSGECSKHEIQILLFVVRMTVSFRRALAPISKSVVEKFTGIRGSGVLHALAALESAGLIKRIPGNERHPHELAFNLILIGIGSKRKASKAVASIDRQATPGGKQPRDQINPRMFLYPGIKSTLHPRVESALLETI